MTLEIIDNTCGTYLPVQETDVRREWDQFKAYRAWFVRLVREESEHDLPGYREAQAQR